MIVVYVYMCVYVYVSAWLVGNWSTLLSTPWIPSKRSFIKPEKGWKQNQRIKDETVKTEPLGLGLGLGLGPRRSDSEAAEEVIRLLCIALKKEEIDEGL